MDATAVCIVIPPSPFLLDERVFPFLGPLKVAAVLEEKGYSVEVLDLSGISNYEDAVRDHARTSHAHHFGITATTPQFPAAVRIARTIRSERPKAKTIIGGTHATLVVAAQKSEKKRSVVGRANDAYAQLEKHFDVIVAGDGEEAIFHALQDDAPKMIDADDRRSSLFLNNETLNRTQSL